MLPSKSILFSSIIAVTLTASAQRNVKDFFVGAPFEVVPTIDKSSRLDMVDYFENGMVRPTRSIFGDELVINSLDSSTINVGITCNSELSLSILPLKGDTLLVATDTYTLPAKESKTAVYSKNWRKLYELKPGLIKEWLTPEGKKTSNRIEIENTIPFITASALFDPSTGVLTLVNTVDHIADTTEYSKISSQLKKERKFLIGKNAAKELK